MEEEIMTYQDWKDYVYGCMRAQNIDMNPISYGSGYAFAELWDVDDIDYCELFISCGLFELEHNDLEPRIEEQMTYWIYQFKQGLFNDEIHDIDVMKADIEKIESMMHLRFKNLECYEVDK
jgi:hypothetical protein